MNNESNRRSKPIEQVSLSVPFFAVALVFFLACVWAVADEFALRRTWKQYQAEFAELDRTHLEKELEEERARLSGEITVEVKQDGQMVEEKLPPLPEIQEKLAAAREVEKSSEYKDLEKQIDNKDREIYLAVQDWKIAKSWDVEHAFFYEEAVKHGVEHEIAEMKAKLDHDAEEIARTTARVDALKKEKQDLIAKRDAMLAEVEKWEEMEKTATRQLASIEDKLARVRKPFFMPNAFWYDGTIQQVVLRGYHRNAFDEEQYTVDRCMTCHMGVDKAGYTGEDVPPVLQTHPDRDNLLGVHPVKKFACTPCHNGQGVAVSSTTAGHDDLDEAHGLLEFWEHPVLGFVRSGDYHEYKKERDPAYTQASCFKCHASQYEIKSDHAELLNAGKEYVTRLGCWGCHNIKNVGDQAIGYNGKKVGPSLENITAKVSPDWIVSWVRKPQDHLPRSRMPHYEDFGKKDPAEYEKDLASIAAFIVSRSGAEWPEFDSDKRSESFFRSGNAASGERIFKTVGCLGCHAVGGRPEGYAANDGEFYRNFDVAPDLQNTGNKIKSAKWVFHWLKDPQGYDLHSTMPSLRLSDNEALDITAYLMKQKSHDIPVVEGLVDTLKSEEAIQHGEWIVRNYGCFGCHNIRGMEKEGKISVELSSFANKQPYELSFGTRTDVPQTWEDWTLEKLKNPRGFETERQLSKMPSFHFSDESGSAVRIFLKSQVDEHIGADWVRQLDAAGQAEEEGRVLVEQYNCKGCHVIDHKGGRILSYYEDPQNGPPQLNGQGERTQADWLFNFLYEIKPIRPWMTARMPNFPLTEEKARKIVQYFQGAAKTMDPFTRIELADIDPASVAKGRDLFNNVYACKSCHYSKPNSQLTAAEREAAGPDLSKAHERLRPEWIEKWIAGPAKIIPTTRMPGFFYLEEDEHGNLIMDESNQFAAEAMPQIRALRDYVLVFGREEEYRRALAAKGKQYTRR